MIEKKQEEENIFREKFDIIVEQNNIEIDWDEFNRQMEGNKRYLALKIKMLKDENYVEKFLKVLKPNRGGNTIEEDTNACIREIQAARFLKDNTNILTIDIVAANTDEKQGLLYTISDTLPETEVGFIQDYSDNKKLTEKHARQSIDQLFKLIEIKLPEDIDEQIPNLQDVFEHYSGCKENITNALNNEECPDDTMVRPLDGKKDEFREIIPERYIEVLTRRIFDIENWQNLDEYTQKDYTQKFRKKIIELYSRFDDVMSKYDDGYWVLSHGDLAPTNMYFGDNNVQFFDWEWIGKTKNKLLAIINDYGNLRVRAWNNPEFKNALDKEILQEFKTRGDEEAGIAIVSLGIFRSSSILAGFFENYKQDKQKLPQETLKREATEADIKLAFAYAGVDLLGEE